ncbi:C-Jun-amino-terminal kinase-interacting protein 1-like [Neosynchiropus ocellatus]
MDKYRPKRPTTLNLFPQMPPAGTQDSINNNSLGRKDSWKASRSSSPHIKGDQQAAPDGKTKAEDKVRASTRRPAPKPPTNHGANCRPGSLAAAEDARTRPRDKSGATQTFGSPRSQRRAGAAGRGRGRGEMKEHNAEVRGKDGATVGREDRRGRLCEESRAKGAPQRSRPAGGLRNDTRAKAPARAEKPRGAKTNGALSQQEALLTAMVVPRTPVTPRKKDRSREQGQNHDRKKEKAPPALSRSSSEGGSNRMSLSSDTEGPPPGPLNPPTCTRTNPITEEDGEGTPTPSVSLQTCQREDTADVPSVGPEEGLAGPPVDNGAFRPAEGVSGAVRRQTVATSESSAGLSYDSVKYTLVVDADAQLELVSLKNCLHGYPGHSDDSDAETVYQSANEEEDPEYQEQRRKQEAVKKQERGGEEEQRRKEEDLRRRREEEVKRRRDVVARVCRHTKVTTSSEEEPNGARPASSRKFRNLFAKEKSPYSATGAGSFAVFSCVLDGVERQQTHRAAYRFVPRHADELHLEADDPVLMVSRGEDLWCQGYNMRTGATGIFPAFYAVAVAKDGARVRRDGCVDQFAVRFLGSVQVPMHKGNDVLCAAMQKVAYNRRSAGQPPSSCVLEVSVRGVKISVQDECQAAHRGDQCFHFFQLKNISFCGCHPKHSRYFGFITKHPDQQRFACHVMVAESSLHPLAESVGKAFRQYYTEHVGYSCPTEDIFIE